VGLRQPLESIPLAAHHFGSNEAFWEAVIERLALYLAPYIKLLRELQTQVESRFERELRPRSGS